MSPDSLSLHPDAAHKATSTIVLRNGGPAISKGVSFKVVGKGSATVTGPSKLAGFSADQIDLTFALAPGSESAKGQLVVEAPDTPPAAVAVDFSPEEDAPGWVGKVILYPALAALILVLIGYLIAVPRCGLDKRLGPLDWDFSKSWASNLTVFSALLGTILSAGVLPEETSATKTATYAGLNLLFGLGVLVGPFVYTAFQSRGDVHKTSTAKEPEYQGRVGVFLIATVLTLWAVVGEFWTIGKLFDEIATAKSMPGGGLTAFKVLLVIAFLSLLFLILLRMKAILESQCDPKRRRARRHAQHARLQAQGLTVTEEDVEPPLERVPVF